VICDATVYYVLEFQGAELKEADSVVMDIPVEAIRPSVRRIRREDRGLEQLARSLWEEGQLRPVLVRPVVAGYEIVYGERLWRAARLAGLPTLQAMVRELTDEEALRLAIVENLQREPLTPVEEAAAFALLKEDGLSEAEIGVLVGKDQSYVATKLCLLTLPEEVQAGIQRGQITEEHAKRFLSVEDPAAQVDLFRATVERDLSVTALTGEVKAVLRYQAAQEALRVAEAAANQPTHDAQDENNTNNSPCLSAFVLNPQSAEDLSDDDLLPACGCDMRWMDFWPWEDFRRCPSRLFGVFARFLYVYSEQGAAIGGQGFAPEALADLELACAKMRRRFVTRPAGAALVFLHVPAHSCEIDQIVEDLGRRVTEDALVICRCGTEQIEVPAPTKAGEAAVSAALDVVHMGSAFARQGYFLAASVACTLAEKEWLENNVCRILFPTDSVTEDLSPISCFETWLIASRSRHISRAIPRCELHP